MVINCSLCQQELDKIISGKLVIPKLSISGRHINAISCECENNVKKYSYFVYEKIEIGVCVECKDEYWKGLNVLFNGLCENCQLKYMVD